MTNWRVLSEIDMYPANRATGEGWIFPYKVCPDLCQLVLGPDRILFTGDRAKKQGKVLMIVYHIIAFHHGEISIRNGSRLPSDLDTIGPQFCQIAQGSGRKYEGLTGQISPVQDSHQDKCWRKELQNPWARYRLEILRADLAPDRKRRGGDSLLPAPIESNPSFGHSWHFSFPIHFRGIRSLCLP